MKDWKKYIFECFEKENFVDVPKDLREEHIDLTRFGTYDYFVWDTIERNGPIASATLSLFFKPKVIVEFGVKAGWTSLLLSGLNPHAIVYGVDIAEYIDSTNIPIGYVCGLHKLKNFYLSKMTSWEFILPYQVDLCFIDGDHSYEAVIKDSWRAWNNRNVYSNWIIAWDDYHPTNEGVIRAVDEFTKEVGYELQKAWSWYWIGTKKATEFDLENIIL